jgi:hypothetical protein
MALSAGSCKTMRYPPFKRDQWKCKDSNPIFPFCLVIFFKHLELFTLQIYSVVVGLSIVFALFRHSF